MPANQYFIRLNLTPFVPVVVPEDDEDYMFEREIRADRAATNLLQASYEFDQYDQHEHNVWFERVIAFFDSIYIPVSPDDLESWPNIAWQMRVRPNLFECTSVDGRHFFFFEFFSRAANFGDSDDEDVPADAPRVLWISVHYEGPFELIERL